MTRDKPLFQIGISLKLKIFGNFWDIVNTQLQEMYHTVQVIFGYFITQIVLIVPLRQNPLRPTLHINSCIL